MEIQIQNQTSYNLPLQIPAFVAFRITTAATLAFGGIEVDYQHYRKPNPAYTSLTGTTYTGADAEDCYHRERSELMGPCSNNLRSEISRLLFGVPELTIAHSLALSGEKDPSGLRPDGGVMFCSEHNITVDEQLLPAALRVDIDVKNGVLSAVLVDLNDLVFQRRFREKAYVLGQLFGEHGGYGKGIEEHQRQLAELRATLDAQ